ncbi:cyclin-like protein [Fomitopsis serialis]|uniref:cyclin-like protein n=1 Tax=Fomitopsis serialis TaxID=139415 RepID=UPI0020083CAF|nr:cyclin-like protein [Neoantrodia serialis]KAH9934789.1 cyclin-like protein [Neoantrodia serialis]
MGATNVPSSSSSQWLLPVTALRYTPSQTTSDIPLEKELYDRARGVEFLFRMGVALQLPLSALYTAAVWFHRFYMRFSLEDYHRQEVAAACLFLATKTEECGRKLRDVAKVLCAKTLNLSAAEVPDDHKDLEQYQNAILVTEEILLEGLCFDFVVESPHAELVDLFEVRQDTTELEECAWSVANDTARTPLCVLFPARIIAAACYILAQHVIEGPQSPSLDVRIASPAPSTSLPTPPSHKVVPPEASRFALEHFGFNEVDLVSIAEVLNIILEFYAAQDLQTATHLGPVAAIPPPRVSTSRERLYTPFSQLNSHRHLQATTGGDASGSPASTHGASTPGKPQSRGWKPIRGSG